MTFVFAEFDPILAAAEASSVTLWVIALSCQRQHAPLAVAAQASVPPKQKQLCTVWL